MRILRPAKFKCRGNSADVYVVDELTREFVAEARDGLDLMERSLIELETRPGNRGLVDEIFRTVHSIKGATGFLGLNRIQALAHAGETLLAALRAGKVAVHPDLISALLELLDSLRNVLLVLERTGGEGHRATDQDRATIGRLLEAMGERIVRPGPGPIPALSQPEPTRSGLAPAQQAPASQTRDFAPPERRILPQPFDTTVRVDVDVLNRMMNLIGELMLTRDQIIGTGRTAETFLPPARSFNAVTSDLRHTIIQARLQPVGYLFGRFPRLARDTAQLCGKQVRVHIEGQDAVLDKTLLDTIRDPLTHLVRNAIAHGIETPVERRAIGKDPEGVIRLRALHRNGSVIIEIEDDGAGISPERVTSKAVESGLISPQQAAELTHQQRIELIFAPGLSTAAELTSISGRGVGMDAVRAAVVNAGGRVELETQAGRSTTVRLTLPLTLAILPALVVRSSGRSFAVPQSAIVKLILILNNETPRKVERMGTAEVYVTPEGHVPIVRLDKLLHLASPDPPPKQDIHLALLETETSRFALLLDEFVASEEIVAKPVSAAVRGDVFTGAAVLQSGELAMILDVNGLSRAAGLPGAPWGLMVDRLLNVPEGASRRAEQCEQIGWEDERIAVGVE